VARAAYQTLCGCFWLSIPDLSLQSLVLLTLLKILWLGLVMSRRTTVIASAGRVSAHPAWVYQWPLGSWSL